jgi:hypothetical protein
MNEDIMSGFIECGILKQKVNLIFEYGKPFVSEYILESVRYHLI